MIYIQGISGTFMAGVAILAKQLGLQVSGVDRAIYPPMSDQLLASGIKVYLGYDLSLPKAQEVIVGNIMSRGMPQVEQLLESGINFSSGPDWLTRNVLVGRKVIAVAGTHGKTSTSSMLLWILQYAGIYPGYLIGGVPNFTKNSADLGSDSWFIVEADEYNTAFFDKRAKCLHIKPNVVILNNLEFDHLDIYSSLAAIQSVFMNWITLLPKSGGLICNSQSSLQDVASKAQEFTEVLTINSNDGYHMQLAGAKATWYYANNCYGGFTADWLCDHMLHNALSAAIVAHKYIDIDPSVILAALAEYPGVARRLELKWHKKNRFLYDDFAHHPTAIKATLSALVNKHPNQKIIVCLELSSYSLKVNSQLTQLIAALQLATKVLLLKPIGKGADRFDLPRLQVALATKLDVFTDSQQLLTSALQATELGGVIVTISSKDFVGVRDSLFGLD